MRQMLIDQNMPLRVPVLVMLCAMAVGGCVSTGTHTKTLTELEAAKKMSAQQAAELDALKKKSQAQADQQQQLLANLQQTLDQEATQRKAAEQQAAELAKEREALQARSGELQSHLDGFGERKRATEQRTWQCARSNYRSRTEIRERKRLVTGRNCQVEKAGF
jgi:septal ring factor EnvC (AmiA/AmiB activator)